MDRITRAGSVALLCLVLAACDSTTAEEHLANARAQMAEADVRTAVIELKNALQKQPDLAHARLLLGEAHTRLGDHPSALKEFERALNLGLDNDRVRAGLLRAKVRLGRQQEVIGALEDQGSLAPEFAVILADAYLESGDLARAKVLYRQGLSLADGNLGLGVIAWREGDVERAAHYLGEAVTLDPGNADAWLRAGEFELSRQGYEEAAAAFAAAADLPAGRLLGHVGLARVKLIEGDLDGAAGEVARIQKLAPEFPLGHYLAGLVRFEQEDLDGAEAAIREVQRVAPEHPPSLYLMGAIKYRQGQLAQAEDSLLRYLAQDPANSSAAKLLGSVLFDRGEYQRVIELLAPRIGASRDPQLMAMYGGAHLRTGNAGEATKALEQAVELAPDMAPFRNQLALSLLASGDRNRAEAQLESAIGVDGEQFQSDYLLAMLRLREGDWQAASRAVEALVEKSPDSPIGFNLRGAVALAQGDREAATAAFTTALEKAPGFLPAVQNLARLAEQAGDTEAAVGHYEAFLTAQPGSEDALVELADLALRRGDPGAAAGHLQRAVDANPESVRARLGLVRLHLAGGRLEAAGETVNEALGLAPELADLLLLRAEIDLRRGNVADARQVATRLQARLGDDSTNVPLYLAVGNLQARVGQFTLARNNLTRALAAGDEPQPAASRTLVRLDLRDGDLTGARERLDGLLEQQANDEDNRLLQADVLLAEGRQDAAREIFTDLAGTGVRDAVMRLATSHLGDGDAAAAARRLEDWVADHPGDLGAELLLADAYMRQDTDRALTRYEALTETGNPVVLNNLAWLYMERNDDRAVAMARRAAAAAPDNPDILDTLGWVLLQKGEGREALQHLKRSAQLNPDNPSVQYHLGVALRESGDAGAAREALTRAVAVGEFPEAAAAEAALAELTES